MTVTSYKYPGCSETVDPFLCKTYYYSRFQFCGFQNIANQMKEKKVERLDMCHAVM